MSTRQTQTQARQFVRCLLGVAFGAVLLLAAFPAAAEGRGRCATVDVPWTFVLPDGTSFEPCALTLCLKDNSTGRGLHEVRVDGYPAGMVMSRSGKSEDRTGSVPFMVFHRIEQGQYALVGFGWPDRDAMRIYSLHKFGKPKQLATPAPSLSDLAQRDVRLPARSGT